MLPDRAGRRQAQLTERIAQQLPEHRLGQAVACAMTQRDLDPLHPPTAHARRVRPDQVVCGLDRIERAEHHRDARRIAVAVLPERRLLLRPAPHVGRVGLPEHVGHARGVRRGAAFAAHGPHGVVERQRVGRERQIVVDHHRLRWAVVDRFALVGVARRLTSAAADAQLQARVDRRAVEQEAGRAGIRSGARPCRRRPAAAGVRASGAAPRPSRAAGCSWRLEPSGARRADGPASLGSWRTDRAAPPTIAARRPARRRAPLRGGRNARP